MKGGLIGITRTDKLRDLDSCQLCFLIFRKISVPIKLEERGLSHH